MKVSEILRRLADIADDLDREPTTDPARKLSMISPLQQKHELLKRATEVDNAYEPDHMLSNQALDANSDIDQELCRMRQAAGITGAVMHELMGDNTDAE
jgi:hypothetical protein